MNNNHIRTPQELTKKNNYIYRVAMLAAVGHIVEINKILRKLCVETCTIPGVVCITEFDLFTYRIPPLPIVTGCMLAV